MLLALQWPLDPEHSRRLLEFCLTIDVDCFTATFVSASHEQAERMTRLMNRFEPFTLGLRRLERTAIVAGQARAAPLECWSFSVHTIELILDSCGGSLSAYRLGCYPEDWAFYRNDELILGIVSHEQQAFLRLTESEFEQFKATGILHVVEDSAE